MIPQGKKRNLSFLSSPLLSLSAARSIFSLTLFPSQAEFLFSVLHFYSKDAELKQLLGSALHSLGSPRNGFWEKEEGLPHPYLEAAPFSCLCHFPDIP